MREFLSKVIEESDNKPSTACEVLLSEADKFTKDFTKEEISELLTIITDAPEGGWYVKLLVASKPRCDWLFDAVSWNQVKKLDEAMQRTTLENKPSWMDLLSATK